MPKFRNVHVWPDAGFAKRPWWDDPDVDSFARITRGICEAYSQVLPGLGLAARASVMRLDATTWHRPRPALDAPLGDMVEVSARFTGSQEHGWLGVPIGFAQLPIDQKRRLGLRIVHHGVLQLAKRLAGIRSYSITRCTTSRRGNGATGRRARGSRRLTDDTGPAPQPASLTTGSATSMLRLPLLPAS